MDKVAKLIEHGLPHDGRKPLRFWLLLRGVTITAASLVMVVLFGQVGFHPGPLISIIYSQALTGKGQTARLFDWDDLEPRTQLHYTSCGDDAQFQCARLELPLDWNNASNPKTIAIAVVRVPAGVPVTDSRYGGAVMINPGGPGGSGVTAAMLLGPSLQNMLDSDEKLFDIISFDPRGVGHTTPQDQCFDSRLERLRRMTLDAVVDSDDYYSIKRAGNLVDTEAVVDAFYAECAAAGPDKCALAAADGRDGPSIRAVVDSMLTELKTNPIPVSTEHAARLITFSDVKNFMFQVLYTPKFFPVLASILATMVNARNGNLLAPILRAQDTFSCKHPAAVDELASMFERSAHIRCSDGDSLSKMTIAEVEAHLQRLVGISPSAGDIWASNAIQCVDITMRSPWTFDRNQYGASKTSNPILFVGNTGDPVTPLVNAYKMQKKFPGSHVLGHDGIGHGSIGEFSSCTAKVVRTYFDKGILPHHGLKCPVDRRPFADHEAAIANMSAEDARIAIAYGKIEETFRKELWGLGSMHKGTILVL